MSLIQKVLARHGRTTLARQAFPVAGLSSFNDSQRQMSTKKRPISPHVTIYKFPPSAISSIVNRATGVGMSAGFGFFSLYALGGSCDIPCLMDSFKTSAPILVPVAKTVVAFPIIYHYAAGLRHLYWDKTAQHLDLKSVEMSSYGLLGSSAFLTLCLAFYTI
eukprot:CAMPEP_0175141858 /NCGR_PEP_ID=MMETSP0087-20121206/12387_1 /TAXON_ID=136419 /ORGANISM="Unknown Unknown, Strain D1" /LENGTH=161 /DNA_ID=CAMNT_0016425417 /DNA_START=30 /DNA_END=515 /DNA_ORIENTATION=+